MTFWVAFWLFRIASPPLVHPFIVGYQKHRYQNTVFDTNIQQNVTLFFYKPWIDIKKTRIIERRAKVKSSYRCIYLILMCYFTCILYTKVIVVWPTGSDKTSPKNSPVPLLPTYDSCDEIIGSLQNIFFCTGETSKAGYVDWPSSGKNPDDSYKRRKEKRTNANVWYQILFRFKWQARLITKAHPFTLMFFIIVSPDHAQLNNTCADLFGDIII